MKKRKSDNEQSVNKKRRSHPDDAKITDLKTRNRLTLAYQSFLLHPTIENAIAIGHIYFNEFAEPDKWTIGRILRVWWCSDSVQRPPDDVLFPEKSPKEFHWTDVNDLDLEKNTTERPSDKVLSYACHQMPLHAYFYVPRPERISPPYQYRASYCPVCVFSFNLRRGYMPYCEFTDEASLRCGEILHRNPMTERITEADEISFPAHQWSQLASLIVHMRSFWLDLAPNLISGSHEIPFHIDDALFNRKRKKLKLYGFPFSSDVSVPNLMSTCARIEKWQIEKRIRKVRETVFPRIIEIMSHYLATVLAKISCSYLHPALYFTLED